MLSQSGNAWGPTGTALLIIQEFSRKDHLAGAAGTAAGLQGNAVHGFSYELLKSAKPSCSNTLQGSRRATLVQAQLSPQEQPSLHAEHLASCSRQVVSFWEVPYFSVFVYTSA